MPSEDSIFLKIKPNTPEEIKSNRNKGTYVSYIPKRKEYLMRNNKKLADSYHTFIYPFSYEMESSMLDGNINGCWSKKKAVKKVVLDKAQEDKREKSVLEYNKYQYFLPGARKYIFPTEAEENDAVIYEYNFSKKSADDEKKASEPVYTIYHDYTDDEKNEIRQKYNSRSLNQEVPDLVICSLAIENIYLHHYPKLKIGILSLELEYHGDYRQAIYKNGSDSLEEDNLTTCGEECPKLSLLEQVNTINDLGRRVFIPCLSPDLSKQISILNARKISFTGLGNGAKDIHLDFKIITQDNPKNTLSFEELSDDYIKNKLLTGLGIINKNDIISINHILDDRMFTVCLMRDSSFPPLRKSRVKSGERFDEYRFDNPEIYRKDAEKIYQFVFLERDCTCQNAALIKEKLQTHLLKRWGDLGTIHGCSEYSLVCVTGELEELRYTVINPFLTQYVEMARLALMQRSAITVLEEKAAKLSISNNDNKPEKGQTATSTKNSFEDINALWSSYIDFQNNFYLPEVTFQEQGVETYDLLKKHLRIEQMNDYLEDEIKNLHNYSILKLEEVRREKNERIEKSVRILTYITTSFTLSTLILTFFGLLSPGSQTWAGFWPWKIFISLLFPIILALIVLLLATRNDKKEGIGGILLICFLTTLITELGLFLALDQNVFVNIQLPGPLNKLLQLLKSFPKP